MSTQGESHGCAQLVCHTTRSRQKPAPGIRIGWDSWEGTACAKKLCNSNFGGCICVLLIKTISMIYICYIKYRENGATCSLWNTMSSTWETRTRRRRLPRDGARVEDHVVGLGLVIVTAVQVCVSADLRDLIDGRRLVHPVQCLIRLFILCVH